MFKVVKDGVIIDIINIPCFVLSHNRNGLILPTVEPYAQGVVSSDGYTIWNLLGREELPGEHETVDIIEIAEEESSKLKKVLEEVTVESTLEVLPSEQVYPRVPLAELQLAVKELTARVSLLEGKVKD